MTTAELEGDWVRLCCEPEMPAATDLLGPEQQKTWGVYRQMVRRRFIEEMKLGLPRTVSAVGEADFVAMVRRVLAEAPPRSRAFCHVVPELAEHAAARWQVDANVPRWIADLTRYEATRYAVADLPSRTDRAIVELDFEKVPALSGAYRLLTLDHPVHRTADADGHYPAQKTYLCVYRATDRRTVSAYRIDAFFASCMVAWQSGASVSSSVREIGAQQDIHVDAERIDALCTVLADLIEHGVVLGSLA